VRVPNRRLRTSTVFNYGAEFELYDDL